MTPDEYQQTGVALRAFLWFVAVSVVVSLGAALVWRFRDGIDELLTDAVNAAVTATRLLLCRPFLARTVAFAGAVLTLAVGVTARVFDCDGGWRTRANRFWCLDPDAMLERLQDWSGTPDSEAPFESIRELAEAVYRRFLASSPLFRQGW